MKAKTKRSNCGTRLQEVRAIAVRILFGRETEPWNAKVRISALVDLDILNFFKERASKAGALAYQTQINQILCSHMRSALAPCLLPSRSEDASWAKVTNDKAPLLREQESANV